MPSQPPGPGSSEPQSEEDEGSGSFQLPSLDEPEEPAKPVRPPPPPPPQRVTSLIADDAPEPELPPEEAAARLKRHHVPPAIIALDRIDADDTFRIRPAGDTERLAQNLARLGQLFPVDLRPRPPDRFQIVCGFRRVEALRFLQRDTVVARLHSDLSDDDALLMAISATIDVEPVSAEELQALQQRLLSEGRLSPAARDMLDKVLEEGGLAPEEVEGEAGEAKEEEVEADELAEDVTTRMAELNQDLALLADVFPSLDAETKQALLQQLSYAAELVAYLERK